MKLAVRCQNVVKVYDTGEQKVTALNGINLDIAMGELMMLVGPSGCGKTTLISVIAGILDQDDGRCEVLGENLLNMRSKDKLNFRARNVGFVFQAFNLLPSLNIGKSWSTASSLTLPIFNWGKINANIASKKAQFDAALLAYQSTVLTAFKEVEDALVAYHNEQQRRNSLAQAVAATQLAVEMADVRYHRGLTTFLDVLQTQQALFQSQRNLVESEAQRSTDLVALYKALGGGWQTEAIVSDAVQLQK
jgi:ABC-type lipoprotein export system ATPase subunit